MPAPRRGNVDFNFDGLTDSVTNLVGGLILLVVMVIGATQPKRSGVEELPAPENVPGGEAEIAPLLADLSVLQNEADVIEQEVQRIEARIPEIAAELEELRESRGGE